MNTTKDKDLTIQILKYLNNNNLDKISSTDIIYNCIIQNNGDFYSYYNELLLDLLDRDLIYAIKRKSKRFGFILIDCVITDQGIALLNDLIAPSVGGPPRF